MKLNEINILHIADLHCDASNAKNAKNPLKKVKLSSSFKNSLGSFDPREIFYNKITSLLNGLDVDILAFTGDISWQNDFNGMNAGLEYLDRLREKICLDNSSVLISPGNHDLDRDTDIGEEFKQLLSLCEGFGFLVAQPLEPILIEKKGIPLVGLNTCLGGTEQTEHGLPKEFWESVKKSIKDLGNLDESLKEKIPDEIQPQLIDLDVPAIGYKQLDKIEEFASKFTGNCVLTFGHHNLLPTHQMNIMPYADLLDSGEFIFRFLNQGKYVLFFHGHTHCDTSLSAYSPEDSENQKGVITCLGTCGLHTVASGWIPSASHVKIFVDENYDFLSAIVNRFIFRTTIVSKMNAFSIYANYVDPMKIQASINELETKRTYTFKEAQEISGVKDDDSFASQLIMRRCSSQINIVDPHKQYSDWRITKYY